MIIPASRADRALGVHLQKIYNTNPTAAVERAERKDVVTISRLSELVEKGRESAMALPEVRNDLVEKLRGMVADGFRHDASDIASSLINRGAQGEV